MTDRSILIHARADDVYRARRRSDAHGASGARSASAAAGSAAPTGPRSAPGSGAPAATGRRRWTTTSTITEMRAGELFAWEVTYFRLPVARWEYRLEADADGVRLVETVETDAAGAARGVAAHHRLA